MTIVRPTAAAAVTPTLPAGRDRAIDLVRAVCISAVVVLHAMMVGVTVTDAGPSFVNASDGTAWIVPLSWMLQVMPLFFVIGGFSGATAFRRSRTRGVDGVGFVAGRIHRLLLPALVTIGAAGGMLALLAAAGAPADLVTLAGFRFAQPLWFLGVFLICQALLPWLLRLHEMAPLRSISALAAAAAVVDIARITTGVEALGFLNLAFVWLAMQQLGFFLADGRIDALSRRARVLWLAGAVAALAISFTSGIHSPDLVANINPPTTALLLVGIAHTALLSLFRRPLGRLAARRLPSALTDFVNPRAMTVYLWHMPVLLCLAGLSAAGAMRDRDAAARSGQSCLVAHPSAVAGSGARGHRALARRLAPVEALPAPAPARGAWRVGMAAVAGTAAVAMLLVAGTSVVTAAIAVALLGVALRTARGPLRGAPRVAPA